MAHGTPVNILLVEDQPAHARLLRESLKSTCELSWKLHHVQYLHEGIAHVREKPTDVVLLDLGLPDSNGTESVRRMHEAAPNVPIVVLTALDDEQVAIRAVQEGAQDYLDKSQLNGRILTRVIRYAIERAKIDRELRRANERFRMAARAVNEIIYEWDLETDTVERSEGLLRVLGFPPSEAPPHNSWWLSRIHEEDLQHVLNSVREQIDKGDEFIVEYRIRHREGHYVYLWDRGVVVRNEQGKPVRIFGGSLDVSQRRHAEERIRHTNQLLSALIEYSPLAIMTLDLESHVITWNPAAERIFGWKAEEVIGREPEMIPEEDREYSRRLRDEAHRGVSHSGLELVRRRKDGRLIDVAFWSAPLYDDQRKIFGNVLIYEDIIARKEVERQRAELQEQLHQAQKLEAVGQLAAGVAHDFNNLLTVILGNVDRMNQLLTTEETRSALSMIEEAAKQATGVTRSLLTFSHKIPADRRRTNFGETIGESVLLLRRFLPSSIEVTYEQPEEPIIIEGDRAQLQQVILNLTINARDAMPEGGQIRIRLSRVRPEEAPPELSSAGSEACLALLSISDTGTGIPPDVLPRIFEPFFTTKPRGQGTGLGLAIVHSIVEDHRGVIQVDSKPGEGTTFRVYLSCVTEEEAERPLEAAPLPRGHGELILLAEDNDYVREVVASSLRAFGYHVTEAADGEAIAQRRAELGDKVAMYVFDHDLPKASGSASLAAIRGQGDHRPAIIMSGSVDAAFENQLDAHTVLLRKPFAMAELARTIDEMLRLKDVQES